MNIAPYYPTDSDAVADYHRALRQGLTLEENVSCRQLGHSDTGGANVEFTLTHNLGRVPRHYIYNIDRAGIVYDSRRSEWTDTLMYLKCSSANAQLTLTIL